MHTRCVLLSKQTRDFSTLSGKALIGLGVEAWGSGLCLSTSLRDLLADWLPFSSAPPSPDQTGYPFSGILELGQGWPKQL